MSSEIEGVVMAEGEQVSRETRLPEHQMEIVAMPEDVDDLGHVSNIAYVRWIQQVAVAHSDAVGLNAAAYDQLGSIFVVRRHEVDYLRPTYAGDRLLLTTQVAWWRGASSERRTSITRRDDGTALVRAGTIWAYVNQKNGRPRRIPPMVRDAFYGSSATDA
jgi:acyl-CoA thioester hydrolase